MMDVCKYEKIGEYHDGRMIWLSPKKENIVYLIMFGDESYIGSSKNIHRRISQYLPALKRGKYDADRVQQAFDKNKGLYINLEEINGLFREYNYNGFLIFEGEYLNGIKNGKGKEYS